MHFLLRLLVLSDDENAVRDFGARMELPGSVTCLSLIRDAAVRPCVSRPDEQKTTSSTLTYDKYSKACSNGRV